MDLQYRFHGERVVKCCVESKTHHIDISGEPEFLEKIQLNYNKQAHESNVFVVGSCGFDSVPCDMGVVYTQNQFQSNILLFKISKIKMSRL